MFKYTSELIINGAIADTVLTDKATTNATKLIFKRGGEFLIDNIVKTGGDDPDLATVYKTPGKAGSVGSATLAVDDNTALFTKGLYNITIYIGMNNKFLSDFAFANWYTFGKPIMVDFEITDTTVANVASLIAKTVNEAVPYNNKFLIASANATDVTFTLTDTYAHIKAITISKFNPAAVGSYNGGEYELLTLTTPISITANVEPFATSEWIIENLRFPSYPNVRYNALYADEYPIPGTVYDQYTFLYRTENVGLGGLSTVGQVTESLTTHVFYIPHANASAFESLLTGTTKIELKTA